MPNQFFYGDNLEVLRRYIHDGTVEICYSDRTILAPNATIIP
jgi:hypothetical protein